MAETKTGKYKDIDFIESDSNILLIAPHAVVKSPFDDENTVRLTRRITKNIGCSSVINRKFRKPDADNEGDKANHLLDLNMVEHAEQVEEFINSIKKVVDKDGLIYVFWIHGISDNNIEAIDHDALCLIGYGQPDKDEEPRYTATQEIIPKLIEKLKENEINALEAPKNSVYRGHDKNRMNQWFRTHRYSFEQVQSIQLEFKYSGVRHKENLDSAARSIGQAIKEATQEEAMAKKSKKNVEQADKTAPAKVENDIPDAEVLTSTEETKSDDTKSSEVAGENNVSKNLPAKVKKGRTPKTKDVKQEVIEALTPEEEQTVEIAYIEIKRIFTEEFKQAAQNAMLTTGKYLIKTFYNDKYEEAAAEAKKKFTKNKSLAKLFQKLRQEKDGNIPQKTWLYNSVNLAIADKPYEDLKKALEAGEALDDKQKQLLSSWTGHLTVSHKITLIQAKDLNENQLNDLIIEIGEKPYKVLELRNRIAELKGEMPKVSTPVEKLKSTLTKKFTKDNIGGLSKKELEDLRKELNKILKTIKAEIDKEITATPPATTTETETTA